MSIKDRINSFISKKAMNYLSEQKAVINVADLLRFRLPGVSKDKYTISSLQAIAYYTSVAPLAKSVDMLSDEFSSINPYMYDYQNLEFTENSSELEKLLNNPNPMQSRTDFMKELAAYYLMAGVAPIMALGLRDRAPVELIVLQPEYLEPYQSRIDGYPAYYSYSSGMQGKNVIFKRVPDGGRFRFIDDTGGRELFYIKTFNPADTKLKGLSRVDQVYYEVEQHLHSSIHNLSTLRKGARVSGLLTSETELSAEQRPRVREQLNSDYAGSDNAGKIMLLDGSKFDFKEMSTNLKDMDFLNLKKEVTHAIYNAFNIPLPLVETDTMTMGNYKEAKLSLYDNGVLPLTSILYEKISHALFPRYKIDGNKFKLWYDQGEITALEPRRNDNLIQKKNLGIYTINELRAMDGELPLPEGGDVLYQPATLLPLGSANPYMTSYPAAPAKPAEKPEGSEKRELFFKILKSEIDYNGERVYTDKEIEDIAEEKGL